MKILMIARPDLLKMPGGDTVQVEQTANYLRKLSVEVDINLDAKKVDYQGYDLIHFFNIIDPEDILGHLYKANLPFVLSTIYLDETEYDHFHRGGIVGLVSKMLPKDSVEYLKTLGKYLLKGQRVSTWRFFLRGHKGSIRYILARASYLLPNSQNEYDRLLKDYRMQRPYMVVPNAVDQGSFSPVPDLLRDLVICVGRIEGRKNQLNLIRAVKGTALKLVLIGYDSPNQPGYVAQCKNEAGPNVTFTSRVSNIELMKYYSKARVHVLPSWFETTGLSSLEAGLMGCNLVVSNRGDVKDYFDGYADFCEPDDVDSIKSAILNAYNKPYNDALKQHILKNFTWEKTAEVTLAAYKKTLTLHD